MSKKIYIDSEKCVGCGICARTCKQSAIEMVNGKAQVTNADSCDKIGNCLPVCPVNAIEFVNTNSSNFVDEIKTTKPSQCYSTISKEFTTISPNTNPTTNSSTNSITNSNTNSSTVNITNSQLKQWPVQIKLVLDNASYFNNANLLISADCCAYAYGNFHNEYMRNKVTIIGCPKLDMEDYTSKLTNIIANNDIKSVTIARMEVPCCGGIENAGKNAIKNSGKFIPWQIVTFSTDGKIVES